ncbi:hypothetical protein EMMF5_004083 [Cystobasidiomycetes sp. EMM_F5]
MRTVSEGQPLNFDYNDTHDEDCVAVAASDLADGHLNYKVGVDVMRIGLPQGMPTLGDFKETLEDMARTFNQCIQTTADNMVSQTSAAEWHGLTLLAGEDLLGALLLLWTAKEAASKAMGEGLGYPYKLIDAAPLLATSHAWINVDKQLCTIQHLRIGAPGQDQYLIAVAVLDTTRHDLHIKLEEIGIDTLVAEVLQLIPN